MNEQSPRNRAERRAAGRSARKLAAVGSGAVLAASAAGVAATLTAATPASANSPIVVTTTADSGAGSLRDAINAANTAAGQDTITFQTGLSGTITLASNLPDITDALQIQGPGASALAIDGVAQYQIFEFHGIDSSAGTDGVSGLTLTRGRSDNSDDSGGAIANYENTADLTVSDSVLTNNYADNDGGGIWSESSSGTLTVSGTTITGNHAVGGGGGLYLWTSDGSLTADITNSTISNNEATDAGGGLYAINVPVSISGSTISGNTTPDNGGGIALRYSSATIENSTISGNSSTDEGGGGIYATDQGEGEHSSTLTIRNSTVSGNHAQYYGGGLYVVIGGQTTIENSTISGNTAKQAGGIYGAYAGITLTQVTITGNSATEPDSGVPVGGVQVAGLSVAKAADRGRHSSHQGDVGGPSATASDGVHAAAVGTVDSVGTIIAGNTGNDVDAYSGSLTLNSDHSVLGTVGQDVTVNDQGGTQQGVADPGLAPLANNGGPTQTMALLPGSVAINKGPNPEPTFPGSDFDQRGEGFARVVDGVVDVGAFEVQPPEEPNEAPTAVVITPKFTG